MAIIVVAIAINADSYRGQSCSGPGRTVHVARDGTERCCIEQMCAKGTIGQMCSESDPTSTQCVPCPDNHFIKTTSKSSDMFLCSLRKLCQRDLGLTIKTNGTLVSNNVCKCDIERGYWDPKKQDDPPDCLYQECDVGHQLTEVGCKPCKPGMFKTHKSIEMCSHWTDCEALGLANGPGGNKSYNPGCVNGTVVHSTQASPVITQGADPSVSVIIGSVFAVVVFIVVGILLTVFCVRQKRNKEENSPDSAPSVEANGVSPGPTGLYEPLAQRPSPNTPVHGGSRSVGAAGPSMLLPELSTNQDQSQTYPKQLHNSSSSSPVSNTYEAVRLSNDAVGYSTQTYEPVVDQSQTYVKQPYNSNLSSPDYHDYEGIEYEGPGCLVDSGIAGDNAKVNSTEEDAEPSSDTHDTIPAHSSVIVTTDKNAVSIKITADTVNFQAGNDNKMNINS